MAMSATTPHSFLLQNPGRLKTSTVSVTSFNAFPITRPTAKPISLTCSASPSPTAVQDRPVPTAQDQLFSFSETGGILPDYILDKSRRKVDQWRSSGIGVTELAYFGNEEFLSVKHKAESHLRELLNISDDFAVLFFKGGGMPHFAAVPANICKPQHPVDYIATGPWGQHAFRTASRFNCCKPTLIWSGESEKYTAIPAFDGLDQNVNARFLHICASEHGVEFKDYPTPANKDAVLVADMSSNFCSKPVDVSKFGVIYACASKNLGASGIAIVIVRKDLIGNAQGKTLGGDYDYKRHAESVYSPYDEPPILGIYLCGLVFEDLLAQGGLVEVEKKNVNKAHILYDAIDQSNGFYSCPVDKSVRSLMNVRFTLKKSKLEDEFMKEAQKQNMVGFDQSLSGMLASIYNAMPLAGIDKLVAFMKEFQARHV